MQRVRASFNPSVSMNASGLVTMTMCINRIADTRSWEAMKTEYGKKDINMHTLSRVANHDDQRSHGSFGWRAHRHGMAWHGMRRGAAVLTRAFWLVNLKTVTTDAI